MATLGDRYTAFIAEHEVAWELTMAALAVAFVAIGFEVDDPDAPQSAYLAVADVALTAVFVLEFATRFLSARSHRAYLRGHWIDLVALIPVARGIRLARLFGSSDSFDLRRASTARLSTSEVRSTTEDGSGSSWRGSGVAVICSAGLYFAENGTATRTSAFARGCALVGRRDSHDRRIRRCLSGNARRQDRGQP